MNHPLQRDELVALAERAELIMAQGNYQTEAGQEIEIKSQLAASVAGTELVLPQDWDGILTQARQRCAAGRQPCAVQVTNEATLEALDRLIVRARCPRVAALNFASARNPGGGWKTGAIAQEETIARASGLAATLARAPGYYHANRHQDSLLYTDHAIWSPAVPVFASADHDLLASPYVADIITMPAPNPGGMVSISEQVLHDLVVVWRHRIRCVLALAIVKGVRHLVLGAWGCGAFGNDPIMVSRWFAEALHPDEPWRRGLDGITFAIFDLSRRRASFQTFQTTLAPLTTVIL